MAERRTWDWSSHLQDQTAPKMDRSKSVERVFHSEHGGYDIELVKDEETLDEYMCGICSKLLRDPRLTLCCGKHYCETCLECWLEKQDAASSCPQCRKSHFEHVLDKSIKRKIDSLEVHCLHKDEGCEWRGELGNAEAHLDSGTGCGYVQISCPNNCDTMLKRMEIQIHLTNDCELRETQCEHCGYASNYKTITVHYVTCEEFPVLCTKGCSELVKRKHVNAHKFKCLMEDVECPFSHAGCYQKLKRKELENHLKEEAHSHLMLFLDPFQQLRSSLTTMSANLSELCAKQIEDKRNIQRHQQNMADMASLSFALKERQEKVRWMGCVIFVFLCGWLGMLTLYVYNQH